MTNLPVLNRYADNPLISGNPRIPRTWKVTEEGIAIIAADFRSGLDTFDIATRRNMPEWLVYNSRASLRQNAARDSSQSLKPLSSLPAHADQSSMEQKASCPQKMGISPQ